MAFTVYSYWLLALKYVGYCEDANGIYGYVFQQEQRNLKRDLLLGLGGYTIYTVVLVLLIYFHILEVPAFLTDLR
ncbi:hypothetical protein [Anabaena sphaerica]|uniref:hypothetical protein n=1 Tax=Anabaena sphaerica TaxID=212446 RepID=UPI001F549104|nr:hypothetical protein [Anabaena sphaerica]